MSRFKNKLAVISGGANGLGSAIAVRLSEEGAKVVVLDLPSSQQAFRESPDISSAIAYLEVDVRKVSNVERAFEQIAKEYGNIDILINNAAINILRPALNVTEMEWDQIISTNLKGTFFCSKEAARQMIRQRKGSVINIASQFAVVGHRYRAVYSASKAGIVGLTRTLAAEWAAYNIRVNAISPTVIWKPSNGWLLETDEFKEQYLAKIPMGRYCSFEDVIGGVLYLASEESSMVTGHNLVIDGGWTTV